MGNTDLHRILKTLCSDSLWNYAVFWKLNHRSRMVLTCEDAYYENCERHNLSESECFGETAENLHVGHYSRDLLGLLVAKMSYHVYSLGEGIVGQVAVTQKHQWIFADATGSCSSFQFSNGWESQFSAGIKTVVVVAVVPHGVVQLGSLNKVTEDTKLVTHVREAFLALQDSSVGHVISPICLPDLPAASLALDFPDCLPPFPYENFGVNNLYAPSSLHESALCDGVKLNAKDVRQNGDSQLCESSNVMNPQIHKRKLENPSHLDSSNTTLKFWAGSELHEALGQAFSTRNDYSVWETEVGANVEMMSNGPTVSQLTFEPVPENLLEAVIAYVCHSTSSSDVKSERSFSKSMQSFLTTDNSAGYSLDQSLLIEENRRHRSSSLDVSGAMPSKTFSSNCPNIGNNEPAKNHNKKKARPGENSRPRPRDRQLIQDRIKELRELVPTGSKCSIDSLLERTIKHMLFLQSITKHADKLSKCAEPKTHQKGTGILGSSDYEQGSSWAVEVGGHLKVCSIVVENLNKKGTMLVVMLCEECGHFLEIAEAIRRLGLTILKAITEAQGDKMWICFIVEGQNNRVMHRMDILWSLVQILEPKSTT